MTAPPMTGGTTGGAVGTGPRVAVTRLAGTPGDPVLVLGPSLGTSVERLWGDCVELLGGWHVLGWDLPGHGAGPAPAVGDGTGEGGGAPFDLHGLASSVLAAVDAELAADGGSPGPITYAGDSVGGAVGLVLALEHPGRLEALVVLCSAARFGTRQAWVERAATVRDRGMAPMVAASPARWFGRARTQDPTPSVVGALVDLAGVDPLGYAATCEAIGAFDVRDRLPQVAVPVLAVAGSDDVATPPSTLADIADGVPDGRLVVLDGVGHLAPLEDPAGVADLLAALRPVGA